MTTGKKANGQLKKGYRYMRGGRVVKAKTAAKPAARRRRKSRRR